MLKNYFKTAIRNLKKNPLYSLINIAGLAVGMACCLFILLYIHDEWSYDRFHPKADHIYRAVLDLNTPTGTRHLSTTPAALAPVAGQEIPEIEKATRLYRSQPLTTEVQNRKFNESDFFFADSTFFDLFNFELAEGNPQTALKLPFTVVLTQETAQRFFGKENPLGKTITVSDTLEFEVTGVFDSTPSQSHFQFDFIAPMASWEAMIPSIANNQSWAPHIYHTFMLLNPGADPASLEEDLSEMAKRRVDFSSGVSFDFILQALPDIHLYSHREGELQANSNIETIYIFGAVGIFILLIACFNFINLSTARSEQRMKEVGIRKTLGANKSQLFKQFMGEIFLMSFLALLLGLALIDVLLPFLNNIAGKSIDITTLATGMIPLWIAGIVLVVSFAAGIYPALFLSGFKPDQAIKGNRDSEREGFSFPLRKGLVVFQFVLSVILIIGTIVVYQQLQFMRNHDLGFEADQILVLSSLNGQLFDKAELLKSEALRNANIPQAAISSNIPGQGAIAFSVRSEEMSKDEWQVMNTQFVDPNFVKTFRMEVVEGRDFSPDRATDTSNVFLLNESAVKEFGWSPAEAVGKNISLTRGEGRIVGVVKDFNYQSLRESIEPLVIVGSPVVFNSAPLFISLRVNTQNISETIAEIEQLWQSVIPERTFSYFFLNEDFNRKYVADQQFGQIFGLFSVLAVVIACMGLFGLAAYAASRRIKEIGIRKVMGATVVNVVGMLSKDFLKLVLIGFLIAIPIAWSAMSRWLQDFAYRIEISAEIFLLAGGAAVLIALATVSWQSIRAALANPVESLKSE